MVNIIFCIDAAFWQHMGVTLASLLLRNKQDQFCVYVVSGEPPPTVEWERVVRLAEEAGNATLHPIFFTQNDLYQHLPVHGHLSPAIYLRLFMAEFLPSTVERVIYLDSDLIIRTSGFRTLWEFPLGDCYLGASFEPYNARQRAPLGFGPNDFYCNSGVMLINVARWREDHISERFILFAEEHHDRLRSPDQDVLNCVLRGRIKDIGIEWNWQARFSRLLPGELGLSPALFHRWKHSPRIIHFTSWQKPWLWQWAPHYAYEYERTLRVSPWKDEPPIGKSLRALPGKLRRRFQRRLEWSFPKFARALRLRNRRNRLNLSAPQSLADLRPETGMQSPGSLAPSADLQPPANL